VALVPFDRQRTGAPDQIQLCHVILGILKRRLCLGERGLVLIHALFPFGSARLFLFAALL
jgi:hypothetical protein